MCVYVESYSLLPIFVSILVEIVLALDKNLNELLPLEPPTPWGPSPQQRPKNRKASEVDVNVNAC